MTDILTDLSWCWSDVSTDDQSRVTKQEQASLCVVSVLCAST